MASIRAILKRKQNKEGKYPIAIRITKNRKSSYLFTGQYLDEKHWDKTKSFVKKSHPNAKRLNSFIAKKIAEANANLLELESNNEKTSALSVTAKMKNKSNGIGFFSIAEEYLKELKKLEKHSRYSSDKPRVGHFRKFIKGSEISFEDIDVALLKRFKLYLKATRKISDRSIINNLIVIRTIYNIAIQRGIAKREHYPFGKGKILIKFPESIKHGLTREEVSLLETIDLSNSPKMNHARNVWLFSFYLAGLRCADLFKIKWTDISEGRLTYRMGKNEKVLSLKLPKKALAIIEEYSQLRKESDIFIFPELNKANLSDSEDVFNKCKNGNKKINEQLVEIAKIIALKTTPNMHIARHTFGRLSGDTIPVHILQKLYRHSSLLTTIGYQNSFVHKETDDALDKVVNFNTGT